MASFPNNSVLSPRNNSVLRRKGENIAFLLVLYKTCPQGTSSTCDGVNWHTGSEQVFEYRIWMHHFLEELLVDI